MNEPGYQWEKGRYQIIIDGFEVGVQFSNNGLALIVSPHLEFKFSVLALSNSSVVAFPIHLPTPENVQYLCKRPSNMSVNQI